MHGRRIGEGRSVRRDGREGMAVVVATATARDGGSKRYASACWLSGLCGERRAWRAQIVPLAIE